ncbi:hypothetical protein ZIOFF_068492 [Zingiber officinale]|uniref:PCI domain-containing protein n=1 Tax=Zingiber officinale TaxID=94328 RepID=A0A8J5CHE1_ZINOF|nr:hypothetical protein ZIOFF_068492 [Zingiber officinale]
MAFQRVKQSASLPTPPQPDISHENKRAASDQVNWLQSSPQKTKVPSPTHSPRNSPVYYTDSMPRGRSKMVDYSDVYDNGNDGSTRHTHSKVHKRSRSPNQPSTSDLGSSSARPDSRREVQAKTRQLTYFRVEPRQPTENLLVSEDQTTENFSMPQTRFKLVDDSYLYDNGEDASANHPQSRSYKRDRSPNQPSASVLSSSSHQHDSDREIQAKARRLARFGVELSQPTENRVKSKDQSSESKLHHTSLDMDTHKLSEKTGSSSRGDSLLQSEGVESSTAVVGLCPDMCPESERAERERKGDLDSYERLDGERNQTSKYLAVKKVVDSVIYTRTAERDANLIRPMPVLQKTIDYLLSLLNQPYDEDFLNIYNFLWDRMRAIRMDLRMQHIFNDRAIFMLEQMIRLHIIAMHELCEYSKGEGFSQGFDAHLNIEQMNKTSVELFHMYDDHRKKGISVSTEKEFRGYYALLKVDKHPGYKVDPMELTRDLAKMTPEIRRSSEILFARNVARACKMGNYINFFHLARKATYLQACLMHAHFTKIRKKALASLHSSLPNNQGIPIADVIRWLGLEGEDVENLLKHHGFELKEFEETYMVKGGPFLNSEEDFPTKRSQFVLLKKSERVVHDICSSPIIFPVAEKRQTISMELEMFEQRVDASEVDTSKIRSKDTIHDHGDFTALGAITDPRKTLDVQINDEKMVEAEANTFSHNHSVSGSFQSAFVGGIPYAVVPMLSKEAVHRQDTVPMTQTVVSPVKMFANGSQAFHQGDPLLNYKCMPIPDVTSVRNIVPISSIVNKVTSTSQFHRVINREPETKEKLLMPYQTNQAANEKLRLILRKWKQHARKKREIRVKLKLILRKWKQQATKRRERREQKIMLANSAFNSLFLGPPIRQFKTLPSLAGNELNIDFAVRERYRKQEESWSTINVSELVAPILSSRNPNARCLCWKLIVLVQPLHMMGQSNGASSRWLLSKVMGSTNEKSKPVVSVPHLSIWRSWINNQFSACNNCCLTVVREANCDDYNILAKDYLVDGATSIIFHVSESIPWEMQRVWLHNAIACIPSGSNLPFLIVSGDVYDQGISDPSFTIMQKLGLHDADMTRVSLFSVIFICCSLPREKQIGFFQDDKLREGLLWLAKNSPEQPSVNLINTREVVLQYLLSYAEIVGNANASNFGPNHFISVFNAALDKLVEEIARAASLNRNNWPCPEVDLLENLSYERCFVNTFLPSIGWSSPVRIQGLTSAINACKLPEFLNDISWLKQSSHTSLEIHHQKLALEECLESYMSKTCHMLSPEVAAREAGIMVQTSADIELCGSCYYVLPRWSIIFRRIQNWRLMSLKDMACSVAYLLVQNADNLFAVEYPHDITANLSSSSSVSGVQSMHLLTSKPCFDEIVEISCDISLPERPIPPAKPSTSSLMANEPTVSILAPIAHQDDDAEKTNNVAREHKYRSPLAIPLPKLDEHLAKLLQKCSAVQDKIDKKLSVYF